MPVARNLLDRRFDCWSPNRAWTTDTTYLLTDEDWLYLAAMVGSRARQIVCWAMSEWMSAKLACDALQMAYWQHRPAPGLLLHSDRGSRYASDDTHCLAVSLSASEIVLIHNSITKMRHSGRA